MNKVGIILPHLGSSQATFYANQYINGIKQQTDIDFTLFYEHLVKPCMTPPCATMSISEIWKFNGILISSTIHNTRFALSSNAASKKIFYVWDLEWLRHKKRDYLYNVSTLIRNDLIVIARSIYHAAEIKYYCNRTTDAVIADFNLIEILRYFKNERRTNTKGV